MSDKINPSELRIGNLVADEDGNARKVVLIEKRLNGLYGVRLTVKGCDNAQDTWITNGPVYGVPISDMLCHMPFTVSKTDQDPKGRRPYVMPTDWCEGLMLWPIENDFFIAVKEQVFPADTGTGNGRMMMNLRHMKYVHSLQNLYFDLYEEELEISITENP